MIVLIAFLLGFAACQAKTEQAPDKAETQDAATPNSLEPPRVDYNTPEHKAARDTVLRAADYAPQLVDRVHVTEVSNNISMQDADRAYLYGKAEIRLCYTNAFIDNNELALDSNVKVTLDAAGKVSEVAFEPAIADEKFGKCMHDAMNRFRFPKPRDGQPATVVFNMNLTHKPPVTAEEIEAGISPDHAHDHDHDHDHGHGVAAPIPPAKDSANAPQPAE